MASPSLRPASPVIEKFGSRSSSSPGGPTPMSPASTGSVGARQAPSMIAAPAPRPMTSEPNSATAPIVSGIATSSSLPTPDHSRTVSARSSFRPVPNSAMISASSERCSRSRLSSLGFSQSIPTASTISAAPRPMTR